MPEILDRSQYPGIARGRSDGQMKIPVRLFGYFRVQVLGGHGLHQRIKSIELVAGDVQGSKRRGFPFEQQAGFGQFERGDRKAGLLPPAGKARNIGSRPQPHLDKALYLKSNQRLADCGTTGSIFNGQIALGRQSITNRKGTRIQLVEQLSGNTLIQPVVRRGILRAALG